MIPLIRVRTAPAIKAIYRGADKRLKDKELMVAQRLFLSDPTQKHVFNSAFWKKAKVQLKKESYGKCAYCEANTAVVAHGDVEHYRPKNIYWWLAYTYDNYLYACQICNQTYKSDNFPITGAFFNGPAITAGMSDHDIDQLCGRISPDPIDVNMGYPLQNFESGHIAEAALLPNPYFDDPSVFLAFVADDVKEEVIIVPRHLQYASIIKAMEDFYGINRIELKNSRYHTYQTFKVFVEASRALPDGAVKRSVLQQIKDMTTDRYLFAGMNRYFQTVL